MSKKSFIIHPALPWLIVICGLASMYFIGRWSRFTSDVIWALIPVLGLGYIGYLVIKSLSAKKILLSRTVRGFLLAPLLPAFVLAITVQNAMWFFVALQISYVSILLLALPAYVWISKRHKVNILHCLGTGLLIGAWPGCFIGHSKELLFTTGFGVATAFIFWLVAIRKKTTKPE